MDIKNLTLENFLSFEKLDFDINGVSVIQGINKDDIGQETNGTGKSAIQSGIEYALFASTSRGIPIKELIKWGSKKAYVSLTIYCPIRKEELLIERGIGRGSKLSLNVNSFPLDFANVNDGNKQIVDWLGISKEDIQNYYIINKEKYESFYTSSNKKKLEMIGRFSNLDILDSSDDIVKQAAEVYENEIFNYTADINMALGRIEKSKQLIIKEESRDFSKEYEDTIIVLDGRINLQTKNIVSWKKDIDIHENWIIDRGNEVLAVNKELIDVKYRRDIIEVPDVTAELDKINDDITSVNKEVLAIVDYIGQRNEDINDLKQQRAEASIFVSGSIICPACKHRFNPKQDDGSIVDEELFIKDAGIMLGELNDMVKTNQVFLDLHKERIVKFEKSKSTILKENTDAGAKINDFDNKIYMLQRKVNRGKLGIDKFAEEIKNLENKIKLVEELIVEIKHEKSTLKEGKVRQVYIGSLNHDVKEDEDIIEGFNVNIEHSKDSMYKVMQWKYNFKMFKSNLSMDVLNVITSFTNKVLIDLGSGLQVKWEGFKVKTNGDLSDKITPIVIRDGEEHNFGSYSGGEKGRLEYANILANQYLINSTHQYGGFNFLSTDEVAESIDPLGLSELTKALELTGKTILLTTHIVNEMVSNSIITVIKKDGKSFIK